MTPRERAEKLFKKMPPFVGEDVIHLMEDAIAEAEDAARKDERKYVATVITDLVDDHRVQTQCGGGKRACERFGCTDLRGPHDRAQILCSYPRD